jgi:hypothetical protein
MPGGPEPINIPMAVDGRSCWRWRLGPNVPGVGCLLSWGTYGGASGVSISQAHRLRRLLMAFLLLPG